MAKTDVKLTATDTYGKVTTTTITDVNPDATSSQLVQMGRLFNNLTQNTYGKTDRINTINCDTESGEGKQTPNLSLAKSTDTKANVFAAVSSNYLQYKNAITYDGDGELFIHSSNQYLFTSIYTESSQTNLSITTDYTPSTISNMITEDVTITVRSTETATYKAAEVTFTVTV